MSFLARLKETLQTQGERMKNRKVLEASMATAALVATADGVVTFSERVAVDQVLLNVDALMVFDAHEAIDRFNQFIEAIQADPTAGEEGAMQAIATMKDDPNSADIMVRIGCAISRADGNFSTAEKMQVQAIADALGIEPPELSG